MPIHAHPSASGRLEAALRRLDAAQPALNALVADDRDAARADARRLDADSREGRPPPALAGRIASVKDVLDLAGQPSTWGLPSRKAHRAERDDDYVARLRRAGALIVGKGNVSQLLLFHESDNPLFGRVNHPLSPDRTPGGSSGGEAALIAAGVTDLGLGTDLGGSVRVPAAWCGIAALMPTAGWLPEREQWGAPPGMGLLEDQVGILARSVADVAAVLGAVSPPRTRDGPPPPLADWQRMDLAGRKVGYFLDDGVLPACPSARRAVEQAAQRLCDAGLCVEPWQPPAPHEAVALFNRYFSCDGGAWRRAALSDNPLDRRVRLIVGVTSLKRWQAKALAWTLRGLGQRALAAQLDGVGEHGGAARERCLQAIRDYRRRFADAMERDGIELILGPATALPAYRHGDSYDLGVGVGVGGSYSVLYNLLGYPAGVVPVTTVRSDETRGHRAGLDLVRRAWVRTLRGGEGLPVGVQLAARRWNDPLLLAAMARAEQNPDGADGP
ncbi:amidase family protein [Crenobacter cavernae]|nr:amidase family protein [Crenobacter cavernae]